MGQTHQTTEVYCNLFPKQLASPVNFMQYAGCKMQAGYGSYV